MSPWSPESLSITLAPHSLVVSQAVRRLGFFGRRPSPASQLTRTALTGDGEPSWQAPLTALQEVLRNLDAHGMKRAQATIVLSNHFVHYGLVPWSDLIEDEEQELAVSRHCLKEAYGDPAEHWELRMTAQRDGAETVVSAVEPELLAGLRDVFGPTDIRLASIQPRLMAVCNRHSLRIGRHSAWLALAEPGSLCLALLHRGRIVRLRTLRLGNDWSSELVTALERESYLSDSEAGVREVFLATDELPAQDFPAELAWHFHWLEAALPSAPPADRPATGD